MIFPYSCYFDSIECESEMGESMHASFHSFLRFVENTVRCEVFSFLFYWFVCVCVCVCRRYDTIRYDAIGMCRVICVIEGQTGLHIKRVANDI